MTVNALFKEIKESLKEKKFITSPEIEARIIITNVLNLSLKDFLLYQDNNIEDIKKVKKSIYKILKRRLKGESLASIICKKEFWSEDFFVTKDVLIPRPETELLIEIFLNKVNCHEKLKVIDIGTGSAILSIILSNYYPTFKFYAIEKSAKALKVAKVNIKNLCHYNNIILMKKDFFKYKANFKFDIIISNPPYLSKKEIHYLLLKNKLISDPKISLNGGNDGLKFYKHLYTFSNNFLKPSGSIIIEHGYQQQDSIVNIFNKGYKIERFKDLNGLPRALYMTKDI